MSTNTLLHNAPKTGFQPTPGAPIERRVRLSHREFYHEYAMKSRPVVITDALAGWPAMEKWTPQFFAEHYPDKLIKFRDGSEKPMGEFIDLVMNSAPQRPAPYWTNAPLEEHFPDQLADIDTALCYFKPNWGARNFLHKGMETALRRGSMFEIYIGGNGGAFPIVHWDGLSSHAFLMQIFGRKRYYAWPPEDSHLMYPQVDPPNISPFRDVENPDLEKYPLFAQARLTTFVLEPGEMLFMPGRWWHTAKMLTPSITLSINTVNGSNWANFSEDMTRKAGVVGRTLKRAYLNAARIRNQLVDMLG